MATEGQFQAKGRGSQIEPQNRFLSTATVPDWAAFEHDPEFLEELRKVPTRYLADRSRTFVTENSSPDIPFRYSANPYRGCEHGCAYCYARPTHEYLGLNGGIDFETQILVKEQAPELLREFLAKPSWIPETITFSGVTDCYQPCERQFELTRGCLQVALECRQPIGIITKNALVARDLDVLAELARLNLVSVAVSVTTLDAKLARRLEPRTSSPEVRLRTIRELSQAGVPTSVMTAPIIPGLNDSEIPALLEAASAAGAKRAGYVMLRLPWSVKPVFLEWLEREEPTRRERVLGLLRTVRDGELTNSQFGERMRGTGPMADQIAQTFRIFTRKYGLNQGMTTLRTDLFVPPKPTSGQLRLF